MHAGRWAMSDDPDMRDVDVGDACSELHEWINGLDYDELAKLYSLHVADERTAVRVMDGNTDPDASAYYLAGKCMRVQLVPVEEPFSLPR
jgi:hypothetical protein